MKFIKINESTSIILFLGNPFLNNLFMGDEKWIVYNNVQRKRSWSKAGEPAETISKHILHQKWLCHHYIGISMALFLFQLLLPNRTINSNLYCQQLSQLNSCLQQRLLEFVNRTSVVYDNTRPTLHWSLVKNWWTWLDVELHQSYSHDLAPTDYHLFFSIQNIFAWKTFASDDTIKTQMKNILLEKIRNFTKIE